MPISSPHARRLLTVISWVLLLALAWTGINGAVNDWPHSHSEPQKIQTVFQGLYGVLAAVSLVVPLGGVAGRVILVAFMISCGMAAGLASMVWAGTSWGFGLLAGIGGLAIAWGLTRLLLLVRTRS